MRVHSLSSERPNIFTDAHVQKKKNHCRDGLAGTLILSARREKPSPDVDPVYEVGVPLPTEQPYLDPVSVRFDNELGDRGQVKRQR